MSFIRFFKIGLLIILSFSPKAQPRTNDGFSGFLDEARRNYRLLSSDNDFQKACEDSHNILTGQENLNESKPDRKEYKKFYENVLESSSHSDISKYLKRIEDHLPSYNSEQPSFELTFENEKDFVGFSAFVEVLAGKDHSRVDKSILSESSYNEEDKAYRLKIYDFDLMRLKAEIIKYKCRGFVNNIKELLENRGERRYLNSLLGEEYFKSYSGIAPLLPESQNFLKKVLESYREAFPENLIRYGDDDENFDYYSVNSELNSCRRNLEFATNDYDLSSDGVRGLLLSEHKANDIENSEISRRLNEKLNQRKQVCEKGSNVDHKKIGPVLDQMRFGHCAFYSSHTLLSYELDKSVSIPQMLIQKAQNSLDDYRMANSRVSREVFNLGEMPNQVMERYLDSEFQCTEDALPNLNKEAQVNICLIGNIGEVQASMRELGAGIGSYLCMTRKTIGNHPMLDLSQSVIDSLSQQNLKDYLVNIQKNTCERANQKSKNLKACMKSYNDSDNLISSFVDEALNIGKPVSIGINADVFYSRTMFDVNRAANHAVTVIDRRWSESDQQCQYLIRNSWGDDWGVRDDEVIGIENDQDEENGNVWMNESILHNSVRNATYLNDSCGS